jgi:thiol-disulfide isomerase/thioredoxin
MKTTFLILILVIADATVAQQLVLTGTITPLKPVELNDTYDGNYWKKTSLFVMPNAAGNFGKTFASTNSKWVWIGDETNRKWVLLSAGRPLHVTIKNNALVFSGAAKKENDLIASLGLETVQHLPFIKAMNVKRSDAVAPVDSVIRFQLPQILHSLDSAQQHVRRAGLPADIEKIIQAELKYYYANAISGGLAFWLNKRDNRRNFHLHFIDTVQAHFPLPTKTELEISPAANLYLTRLFQLRTWRFIYVYQQDKDRVHADSVFLKTTGISVTAFQSECQQYGERPVFHARMKALLPTYAWERVLNNELFGYCMSGHLQDAARSLQFIQRNTQDAQLVSTGEALYAPLKKSRDQYATNLNIRIRQDYKNISSLDALLAPYKGRVVFIDMWGTWCPHCISDMAYAPVLKRQLEDQDVVFLYLAQDNDEDDEKWRDFIFANNLTGEHVRKTADEMTILWNAFGIPDNEWAYPRYLIVDRSGKIVIKDAKRPSETDALHQQLLAVVRGQIRQ